MDWVKLAQRYYTDPKVRELDDAAELMFVRGLARAGEVGRGGFIPESDLPLLTRRRRYRACVDALLAAGLWSRDGDGYRIAAWGDWQDELDALTKRRTADRERKRRQRQTGRESFLAKHGRQCRRCGATENIVIDHIVPRSRGGPDTDDNKQPLCWSCNAEKRNMTEPEYTAYLQTLVDSGYVSADKLKFVPPQRERETKKVLKGGDTGTARPSTAAPPPVDNQPSNGKPTYRPRCARHAHNPDPPLCGACKEIRLADEAAAVGEAQQRAERDRTAATGPRCGGCGNPLGSAYHRRVCATRGAP